MSFPVTQGEQLAQIIPVDLSYPPGHIQRYGGVGDGVFDNALALKQCHDQFDPRQKPTFGGRVTIPEGRWFSSQTWVIQRQLHIRGDGSGSHIDSSATQLHFPANIDGIRLHSSVEPGFTNAAMTTIKDLALFCTDRQTTGHGIHATTEVHLDHLNIQYFAEDGIHIAGNSGTGTGAANSWTVNQCACINNGRDGIHVFDADANAGTSLMGAYTSNGRYGIYDESKLGNTYIAGNLTNNAIGSAKTVGDVNTCLFIGVYVERFGNFQADLNPATMVYGRELARESITALRDNGTRGGFNADRLILKTTPDSQRAGELQLCDRFDALITASLEGSNDVINFLRWDEQRKTYVLSHNNSIATENIGWRITTHESAGETGGRSSPLPPARVEYPNGLWLGDGTNAREIHMSAAMPSTGEYAKGDVILNRNPEVQGSTGSQYVIHGWHRLTSGSGHVLNADWVELRIPTGG